MAAGPLSANAQALYLDPTRTIAEPDRVITPLINAFTGSNTTYQTGGALPVDGTNFSGTTTTNDDIAVKAVPGIPTITAGGPVTFCQGNSVILTSSDGTSYLWSNGATSKSITVTASGNYSVQVTNSVGCQSNSSVETTVTVNQKPAAPVATAATALICEGFTANWNAVPGATSYGIAISTNELFSSNVLPFDGRDLGSNATSYNFTGLSGGDYYYRVWSYNSCGASAASSNTIKVSVAGTPTTSVAGPAQTLCEATTATLAGNTATVGTGVWTRINGTGIITSSSSPTSGVTGLSYGANVFRWTISNGTCTASSSDVTITRNAAPAAPGASAQTFCSADAKKVNDLSPSGTGIKWYSSNSASTAYTGNETLSTGTYFVSQTSGAGCESGRTSVSVTVNPTPAAATLSSNSPVCSGSNAVFTITGTAGNTVTYTGAQSGT
ncbi:hypothetical protein ACHRVK_02125, partial [Flavobacterium plurextorum]|uniref:Ig-like domain-containing protein n=2 Tax=Flavobacterium plurextorum TaxID=1114867 RepID=UPI003757C5CA